MYDTKPLIKKKNNPGRSSFVSSQQVWKWKETEERGGYKNKDSGTATGQTLQHTEDKEQSNQGCSHNSATYYSDPQGKRASENVTGVMKIKHSYKNREVDNNMEDKLSVPQAVGKPGVKSSQCLRKSSHLTCIY